jgi:O-antigen/teichoic acid export membrane protein
MVLGGSFIMLLSMALVNVFNLFYNMFMARTLGPAEFGHINAAVTLLLLASCFSLAFQLVCSKFVVRNTSPQTQAWVYQSLLKKSWLVSFPLGVGLFAVRGPVAAYLNFPSSWIVAALAFGVAVYAPVGVKRGALQGLCLFQPLGVNFVAEAFTRFAAGLVLVLLGYGTLGAVGAISLGVLAAYLIPPVPRELRRHGEPGEPPSFAEGLQVIVFFIGQVIINNIDILLVKHFFPPEPAGLYAAISQLGRFLYFICWFGVVNVMFPVSAAAKDEDHHPKSLLLPLLLVFGISVVFVVAVAAAPHLFLRVLFGARFVHQDDLLALYAAATALYSLSVVLMAYEMSRRIANTGWLQLFFSGLLAIALGLFHGSLRQVVMLRIVLMLAMLAMVSLPFLRRHRQTVLKEAA